MVVSRALALLDDQLDIADDAIDVIADKLGYDYFKSYLAAFTTSKGVTDMLARIDQRIQEFAE